MKRIVKCVAMLALVLAASTQTGGCIHIKSNASAEDLLNFVTPKPFKGNGKLVTKHIELPSFIQVSAHRAAEVTLVGEDVKRISVRADENLMPYVVITCQHGVLDITLDEALNNVGDFTFEVTVPANDQLKSLKASSAAEIELCEGMTLTVAQGLSLSASSSGEIRGAFEAKRLEIDGSSAAEIEGYFRAPEIAISASSSADVEGRVVAEQLTAAASSAAEITLEGEATRATLTASSAGDIDSEKLTVAHCRAEASSGADICLHCTRELSALATSGGSIRYSGAPATTDLNHSSGGSVTHKK